MPVSGGGSLPAGRALVRNIVQSWLDPTAGGLWATSGPAPPDSLDKVWTSFPKELDFKQWARIPVQPTRAHAVVFIRGQSEVRGSFGGDHQGWKAVTFDVVVQVFAQSSQPKSEDTLADVDTLADSLAARIRADHRFGQAPNVVLRVAEPSLDLSFGEPFQNAAAMTEQWFQISFQVECWLQA